MGKLSDFLSSGVPGGGCGKPGLPDGVQTLACDVVGCDIMGYRGLTLFFQICGVCLGLGGQGGAGFASFLPRVGPAAGTPEASSLVSLPCRVGATLQGPDCRHRTGKDPLGRQEGFLALGQDLWALGHAWLSQSCTLSLGSHDPMAATHLPGPVLAAV